MLYYVCVKDKKSNFVVYESEPFRLSEIDFINLIKILMIERRNTKIGQRLVKIYQDSTIDRPDLTNERLQKIGLNQEKNEKTKANRNTQFK